MEGSKGELAGEIVEGKVDWKGRPAIKGKHGGQFVSLLVLACFAFENMAVFSIALNSITYFNGVMHFDLADAANMLTNYMGTNHILSVAVAFLADAFMGRFAAVLVAGCVEFTGLSLLALQAHYPKFKPPLCNVFEANVQCEKVTGVNVAILLCGLYLVAQGTAGIKAALPSHGADQFDEKDPGEARQMSSFFNWLLLALCLGGVVSLIFIVRIQTDKGWDLGFGVCAIAVLFAMVVFIAGLPSYRMCVIQGTSATMEIIQVYVASFRNRKLQLPENPEELYEVDKDKESNMDAEFLPHRDIFRFLDKAAIQTTRTQFDPSMPETLGPWKMCRVTQVENAKIIFGMVPIFLSTIIMSTCLAQLQTFSIQQGITMDTSITHSFSIPPASLPIIPIVFMIIIIPIYDRIFVPFARCVTGHPTGITHLQRIGVGLVLASVSMAVAALVEVKRKGVAEDHGMLDALPVTQPLPISTFWLSFQYFIFGIADLFTYIGLLEFFYSEAPNGLKSLSTCFLWCSIALGYFFSTILVQVVNQATKNHTKTKGWLGGNNINRNHLNLFYWLLSILSLINLFNYLYWARRYRYRAQPPQVLPAGRKIEI
ncbi:protein NRT1/ PTR FAMILY 4.5-like [Aristolochia californica]|uniref:protein NRT1/ PTR FAMILY 4.5-like n=1 Tax=Aristolochia californica TaxID=171875 RepID=UPI0035DB650A